MTEKFVSEKNLKFLLNDVFDTATLTKYPYYEEHSQEIFDMVLETALKIGKDLLRPNLEDMDKNPPEYVDGQVKVHPSMKTFLKECGEGGWIGSNAARRWSKYWKKADYCSRSIRTNTRWGTTTGAGP